MRQQEIYLCYIRPSVCPSINMPLMASQVTRVVGALCAKSGSKVVAAAAPVIKSMHAPPKLPRVLTIRRRVQHGQRALNFCTTASTLDQFVAHLKRSQVAGQLASIEMTT